MYNMLAISLTNKCNATCKTCCFECGPENSNSLSEDTVINIITQAKEIGVFKKIAFSGGEPFLNIKLLNSVIKHASSQGFFVSCISNGFWGIDRKKAKKILLMLKESGLKQLNLSYDEFH